MVDKEILKNQKFIDKRDVGPSYMVTKADVSGFKEDAAKLPFEVEKVIRRFCEKNGFEYVKSTIADMCKTDPKTLREYINGKQRISRQFLYKLTIGLGLSKEEATPLFIKCGGKLREDCLEDFIVLAAIEDQDDIESFFENFNENVPKASRLH